jgi:broad specificity phosphatase PhoE
MLAEMLGISSVAQAGLQEREFGKWSSWDWPRISVELSKLSMEDRYTFKPTGGESWQDMEVRVRAALHDIADRKYDSAAVMTHAGTMRVIFNILNIKSKNETINFIPALGRCIVIDFDTSTSL